MSIINCSKLRFTPIVAGYHFSASHMTTSAFHPKGGVGFSEAIIPTEFFITLNVSYGHEITISIVSNVWHAGMVHLVVDGDVVGIGWAPEAIWSSNAILVNELLRRFI